MGRVCQLNILVAVKNWGHDVRFVVDQSVKYVAFPRKYPQIKVFRNLKLTLMLLYNILDFWAECYE